jgi:hypothetical protein
MMEVSKRVPKITRATVFILFLLLFSNSEQATRAQLQ